MAGRQQAALLEWNCVSCRLHVTDDPRLTMKWSSAPLVLMTLLMALVTLAEEVASKNKVGRGRGSRWWYVAHCITICTTVAALRITLFNLSSLNLKILFRFVSLLTDPATGVMLMFRTVLNL